jgi:uncharacterized protein YkwD
VREAVARAGIRFIAAAVMLVLTRTASADLVDIVNGIRETGCEEQVPVETPVRSDTALDAAARFIMRGTELAPALDRAGYRATRSTLINIGGAADEAAIREVLAGGFCDAVNNRAYTAVGTFVRAREFWLVLAAPYVAHDAESARAMVERVLELVNDARAEGRLCGGRRRAATRPLELSAALTRAAAAHARDMAANGFMGHRGSDGSGAGERANRAGYRWRAVGENVAAGQQDADAVVRSWLDSPGHCENIMGPQFAEMGVAFEQTLQSDLRILWAQVFAAPR